MIAHASFHSKRWNIVTAAQTISLLDDCNKVSKPNGNFFFVEKLNMMDLLKEVILEQKETTSELFVDRHFPEKLRQCNEIIIISGIRRCGKSVLLQQIRKANSEHDYYINFDDERIQ